MRFTGLPNRTANLRKRAVELIHACGYPSSILQFLCIALAITEVTVTENLLELPSNESTCTKWKYHAQCRGLRVQYTKRPDSKPRMARNLDRLILPPPRRLGIPSKAEFWPQVFCSFARSGEGRKGGREVGGRCHSIRPSIPFLSFSFPLK